MKKTMIHALQSGGEIQADKFKVVKHISEKETISSVVTDVDLESEKKIIGIIEKRFPEHNILSEESGFKNKNADYTWIIDPLDGTSNYVAGLPWFGVLIALLKGTTPILTGAYLPITGDLYIAQESKGTTLNGKSLHIENIEIKNTLVAFSMDYTTDEPYMQRGIKYYKYLVQNTRNVRSTNCLMDYLLIAEGKFGGCINMFSRIWDITAPWLIIKEAGGIMKNLDFSELVFTIDENCIQKNIPVMAGSKCFVESLMNAFCQDNDIPGKSL